MKNRYARIITAIILTMMLTILFGTMAFAETAEEMTHVRATASVNIRTEPNTDCAILGTLNIDDLLVYNGEIFVDKRGVAWYSAVRDGEQCWISAKYSVLVSMPELLEDFEDGAETEVQSNLPAPTLQSSDEALEDTSPLADYPDYYDGFVFAMTGSFSMDDNGNVICGCNDREDIVNWQIQIYEAAHINDSVFFTRPAPELEFCSWDDNVIIGEYMGSDYAWDRVLEGKTLSQIELFYQWPDEYELHTYTNTIYMPERPEIEGPQRLVYVTENEALIFDFDLINNGGYSGTGLGWYMDDVEFQRCSLDEYEQMDIR